MPWIFVSYRRADTAYATDRICERLCSHFGRDAIFEDVRTIEKGADFVAEIHRAIERSYVLLAIIGRGWLDSADATNRPRLFDPADYVRSELEQALARHLPILPVYVDSLILRVPALPNSLRALGTLNAATIRPGSDFDRDMADLVETVRRFEPRRSLPPLTPQNERLKQIVDAWHLESGYGGGLYTAGSHFYYTDRGVQEAWALVEAELRQKAVPELCRLTRICVPGNRDLSLKLALLLHRATDAPATRHHATLVLAAAKSLWGEAAGRREVLKLLRKLRGVQTEKWELLWELLWTDGELVAEAPDLIRQIVESAPPDCSAFAKRRLLALLSKVSGEAVLALVDGLRAFDLKEATPELRAVIERGDVGRAAPIVGLLAEWRDRLAVEPMMELFYVTEHDQTAGAVLAALKLLDARDTVSRLVEMLPECGNTKLMGLSDLFIHWNAAHTVSALRPALERMLRTSPTVGAVIRLFVAIATLDAEGSDAFLVRCFQRMLPPIQAAVVQQIPRPTVGQGLAQLAASL